MNHLLSSKVKASLTHLAVSALIASACAVLVFLVWYPSPFASTLGVNEIVLLMLVIDVCLGPVLTFIVYKPFKTTLKFDIATIALVQVAALVYGMYTIGLGRPVYLAYEKQTLSVVTANEVYYADTGGKTIDLLRLNPWQQPFWGPQWVSLKPNLDLRLSNDLAFSSFGGGPTQANLPVFHQPFAAALATLQTSAKPLASLELKAPSAQARILELRQRYPVASLTVPVLIDRQVRLLAIFNPASGAVLGIEPVDVF
jgi:hypothetical protein